MWLLEKLRFCSLKAVLISCGAKIALCQETPSIDLKLAHTFYCKTSFVYVFHPALREMCVGLCVPLSFSLGKHQERRVKLNLIKGD